MVERSSRGKGKQKLLDNHQRCWLWGRNLVRETLAADRWPILELFLAADLPPDLLEPAMQQAQACGIECQVWDRDRLQRLSHTAEHQGFLAKMGPYPYQPVESILEATLKGPGELRAAAGQDGESPATLPQEALVAEELPSAPPLYLILDAIQDPYNFGAMLRSAGAFGVSGVFIGHHRQVPVTSLVARSSAGVVNHLAIGQTNDLPHLAETLRQRGVRVIGAAGGAAVPLTECNFRKATAIVIGNEGDGISPLLLSRCDQLARIPLHRSVESLNAAAAAAVFFFEANRQRGERELSAAAGQRSLPSD
ncbi:MAG: TrmH family RNA methyltransferase [Planctomycetales bacterium]